jgi:hypothetical protein
MTSTIGRHRGAASAKTDDGLDGGTANDTDHGLSGERESVPSADFVPRRLVDILRLLPESELRALISRMGIKIDAAKRIDPPSQVARVLVGLPDVRDPIRLPTASRELLQRIAEAGGSLIVPSLPVGLEALVGRGVVYARKSGRGIELVLPIAFLVQLRSWDGEDPRAFRALVAQAPLEAMSAIAGHYLGRPATPPITLALEAAYEVLTNPDRVKEELEKLAPVERRLLEAVEVVGGEVDTQELLDLEREPMRLRSATGVAASRRGAGFALERRGFLIPIHPSRHVIPTEVAALVGAERRKAREARRAQIRTFVLEEDHAPRRARFAVDPGSIAVAMAFCVRDPTSEVRPGVGTPRSLIVRIAQRLGRDPESAGLVAALSRAAGLWDATAALPTTPPGSLPIHRITPLLFATWRRGGSWDEARPERELLRAAEGSRDASPIGALRQMVIDALQDLGEGRWVPWQALQGYLAEDERMSGVERLLRRWAERVGVEALTPLEITRRIALESLPALGVVDLGGDPEESSASGVTLRLTPRGRALLADAEPSYDQAPSRFLDGHVLRVAPTAKVAHVLGLAPFAELGRAGADLELVLTVSSIARALSAGVESDIVRSRIEAVAPLPDTISRILTQASVVVGRVSFVAASGFLWIEDPEIRELLRTRRPAAELFIDPSPPAGLLICPDVDMERLVRRCRALGVEIEAEGGTLRIRSNTPPPGSVRARSRTPMPKPRGSV